MSPCITMCHARPTQNFYAQHEIRCLLNSDIYLDIFYIHLPLSFSWHSALLRFDLVRSHDNHLDITISGLSGCTPEQINAVDPQFIQAAKISQTLTPGRNNGFLNMLAVMKRKASEAVERETDGSNGSTTDGDDAAAETAINEDAAENNNSNIVTSFDTIDGKPMYNAMLSSLIPILKPASITLTDNSSQHAGHAGSKGWEESGESHFALEIVADAFEGLNLVKRHQLIYMLLGEVMPKIHALEISAKSTSEVK